MSNFLPNFNIHKENDFSERNTNSIPLGNNNISISKQNIDLKTDSINNIKPMLGNNNRIHIPEGSRIKIKPTFNNKYDKGIYEYPIQGGKNRFHPTQKNIKLFEDLIKKHSNEEDVVLDTFLGGGTTIIACKNTNRKLIGCEISKEYYDKIKLI